MWLDTDYRFLSAEARKKYKVHNLARAAAFALPSITEYERLLAAERLMHWSVIFDDYYELCPVREMETIRDRVLDILAGKEPSSNDIGVYRQIARFRSELMSYMPRVLLERVIEDFYGFITYGMMEETP